MWNSTEQKKSSKPWPMASTPYTGEHFPADGPYQRADTVRSLYTALEALDSGQKRKKPTDLINPKAGAKWADEEIERLTESFRVGAPFADIAKDHGRTTDAITARLVKLGLIEDNPANRSGAGNRPTPISKGQAEKRENSSA